MESHLWCKLCGFFININRSYKNCFRMKRNSGFTLIELLVVIAIIALLLAILIPALSMAKKQAMNLLCQSNLRQYSIAAEIYLSNNEESYPRAWVSLFSSSPSGTCQWHDEENFLDSRPDLAGPLWGYLETQGVHLCPIFRRMGREFGAMHPGHNPSIPIVPQYNYSMNYMLGPGYAKKRTNVRRAHETFFFAEENMWITSGLNGYVVNDNALCVRWNLTLPRDTPPPYVDSFGFFHNSPRLGSLVSQAWSALEDKDIGHTYASFVDGHVGAVRPDESYKYARP